MSKPTSKISQTPSPEICEIIELAIENIGDLTEAFSLLASCGDREDVAFSAEQEEASVSTLLH
jgi:hypothetical protein